MITVPGRYQQQSGKQGHQGIRIGHPSLQVLAAEFIYASNNNQYSSLSEFWNDIVLRKPARGAYSRDVLLKRSPHQEIATTISIARNAGRMQGFIHAPIGSWLCTDVAAWNGDPIQIEVQANGAGWDYIRIV